MEFKFKGGYFYTGAFMAKEQFFEKVDESEKAVFNKKLKKLSKLKGAGTELISVYIPPNADRSTVMGQLTEEISQSSNIKDPKTRKNVQGALRKVINFLKRIDFKIPDLGIVVFCGNISQIPGKSDIKLFTIRPLKKLETKLYWCDSSFHLQPLQRMSEPEDIYGILTIDKSEATIAVLKGKKYDIIGNFKSRVAGKQRAGGQSAKRFEHLREEALHNFFKETSERTATREAEENISDISFLLAREEPKVAADRASRWGIAYGVMFAAGGRGHAAVKRLIFSSVTGAASFFLDPRISFFFAGFALYALIEMLVAARLYNICKLSIITMIMSMRSKVYGKNKSTGNGSVH